MQGNFQLNSMLGLNTSYTHDAPSSSTSLKPFRAALHADIGVTSTDTKSASKEPEPGDPKSAYLGDADKLFWGSSLSRRDLCFALAMFGALDAPSLARTMSSNHLNSGSTFSPRPRCARAIAQKHLAATPASRRMDPMVGRRRRRRRHRRRPASGRTPGARGQWAGGPSRPGCRHPCRSLQLPLLVRNPQHATQPKTPRPL
mmetsp:Transcript_21107/g.72649  ORF Transcript_21107/g.72649 Transcript_21107/m.72649 type:complete len:201 (-) Transcript_21107:275-877(-)